MKILLIPFILLLFTCKTPKIAENLVCKATKSSVLIYKIPLSSDSLGSIDKKITIERDRYIEKYQFVEFPTGGTVTEIQITPTEDSDDYPRKFYNRQDGLLWNITRCTDGVYAVQYSSCNYGGSFQITLKSKAP